MYPHDVRTTDIWITNCAEHQVFEYVVKFSAQWPHDDIWADVPHDMSVNIRNEPRGGPTQKKLMSWNWWGIYRRTKQ